MPTFDSPAQPERFAQWMIIFSVCAGIAALSLDFIYTTAQILFDPTFLKGFSFFLVQVVLVSAVGGGIGAPLGGLILRSRWITESAVRFLRLGMWFLFFAAWTSPAWLIMQRTVDLGSPDRIILILDVAILIIPTTLFAACYHHLTARYRLELNRRSAALYVIRSVLLHASFYVFLAQLWLYEKGWYWFEHSESTWWARATATIVLLAPFLLIVVWGSSSRFEKTSSTKGVAAFREIRASNWKSFIGAGILWMLCFVVWNTFSDLLSTIFMIAPLHDVISAAYTLLTTGSMIAKRESTLWWDIAVSAREISEGLLLSGVLALILVKVVETANSRVRLSWLFALTHLVPIVLAFRLIFWIGVGHWLKVVMVAAASLYPFTETLWGLRAAPRMTRVLMALDNALPYAFFGMFFGEAYGATAGVGFFVLVARATGYETEALAASLIALSLMIAVSFILRFIVKRLITAEAELMLLGKGSEHRPVSKPMVEI
jgi:ABC-type nitrate/sulfonate/bicarbonate transport system permease component